MVPLSDYLAAEGTLLAWIRTGLVLMLAAPTVAIDPPLKVLIWEDSLGKVWLSYNSPEYLKERHGLPQALAQNLAIVGTLAAKAGE